MTTLNPTDALKLILEKHGLTGAVYDGWVAPNNQLPAIRARWYPGEGSGRLDIHVMVEEGVLVEEIFAGIGEGDEGLANAFENFIANSLHVLLAAFWEIDAAEHVSVENWLINERRYRAYVGNLGIRAAKGSTSELPENLVPSIHTTIQNMPLKGNTHWFRTFFCNYNQEHRFEALSDNIHWEEGASNLQALPWSRDDGYFSVRNFVVLRAV
ncbi:MULTISPECIES: DUF6348 family protein [Pseudomonas]|uniref:DUF6348 family protein n=1 Tax=Pseudomonas TaxID=286 RepID=UPI00123A16A1|nr:MULTISPECIES: DUF6348 family protein [Pseudomonas]MBA1246495.1 hypothetical protein [Pseudomonas zeshuii]QEU27180.1 hypothetical protein FOB45_05135 [Pseudomonas luteola]